MNISFTQTCRLGKGWHSFAMPLLILLSILSLPDLARAGTCTWDGSVGDWSDASKWSPAGIPSSTDDIVINGGLVTLDISVSVNSLTLSGDATLSGTEPIVVNDFNWESGSLSGSGEFRVNGILTISTVDSKTISGKDLGLYGTGTWVEGDINISNGRTFFIASGAYFTASHESDQTIGSGASGTINIAGTFDKTYASTTNFTGVLNVSGALLLQEGVLQPLTVGSGSFSGTIDIAANASLLLSTGTYGFSNSVTGDGTLAVAGATANFEAGSSLTTSLDFTTGNFNNNTNLSLSDLSSSASGTIGGTGNTTVTGTFTWSSGTIAAGATVTSTGNAILGSNSPKSLNGTLVVEGTADWSNGNVNIGSAGILRVNASGTMTITHTGSRLIGGTTNGLFEILGNVTKNSAGTTRVRCKLTTEAGSNLGVDAGILFFDTNSSSEFG
ncbi:MAG: hypothetical protein IT258_09950, partial [Saprospiraceae bacterium]|nr:hypothetical protein [Saprospiraceae bacterium]